MISIPWYFKIIILLSGLKFELLGLLLIILDSHFHFTSTIETLQKSSPDWIIARLVFNSKGFSEIIHKIMGVALFSGVIVGGLYSLKFVQSSQLQFIGILWFKFIQPATLIIIASAILFKNLTLISNKVSPDNSPVAFL